MPLEHLFDAELTYGAGMALPAEHGEGQGLRAPHEPAQLKLAPCSWRATAAARPVTE